MPDVVIIFLILILSGSINYIESVGVAICDQQTAKYTSMKPNYRWCIKV